MQMIIIVITTLIGLLLTTCSAPTAPMAHTPSATVVPGPTSTSEPLPADALAIYHKRGCIQGLNESLIIRAGGTLDFTDTHGATQQAHVEADQLTTLQGLLARPEFARLQSLYQSMGADLCVYTITVQREGRSFSVTTMDGAEPPELLREVLKEVQRLCTLTDGQGGPQ